MFKFKERVQYCTVPYCSIKIKPSKPSKILQCSQIPEIEILNFINFAGFNSSQSLKVSYKMFAA